MIAYKFLSQGAVGRFSRHSWPLPAEGGPGDWVEVEGRLELCANGVHACTALALAYWLDEELWVVEVDRELRREQSALLARRGRLVRRVKGWPDDAAAEFARACAERADELAARSPDDSRLAEYANDAAEFARRGTTSGTALAAYAAAVAAEALEPGGFVAERRRQGEWLAARLALEPSTLDGV